QLNATASVPGTFVYSPAAGTVLPVGNGQMLSVTFTPTDAVDYTTATAKATINVLSATSTPTLTPISFNATNISAPVVMNGKLYSTPPDAIHGNQLWTSDGPSAGTTTPSDGNDANGGLAPTELTVVGNTLYFAASDPTHGPQLWRSDGTAAGTGMVTNINP